MPLRRVLYRVLWPAVLVLPLWVLLGRAFFGVPLGLQFVGQVFLVPLLVVGQAVAAGLVVGRRSVREGRAVSWLDAGLLLLTWVAQLALGFFLVDGPGSGPSSSAFTAVAGADRLDLSTALYALSAVLTVASVVGLVVAGGWQFLQAARRRVAASLADLERVATGGARPPAAGTPGLGGDGPVITITPRRDG